MKKYHIGCSGYMYNDWKNRFYPKGLAKKEWLKYYADHFRTAEINNSFYQLPSEETLQRWYDAVSPDFRFSLKGSRYVTQMKKLKDPDEPVWRFYEAVHVLKDKLASVLWQCPGNFRKNLDRLEAFCQALSDEIHNVIEFRHPSWWDASTYEILRQYGVTFCTVSAAGLPGDLVSTSDRLYLRLHGSKNWYDYRYTEQELQVLVNKLSDFDAENIYVFFNNDVKAYSVENARRMRELIE